jgi:IS5 family transposase
MGRACSTLGKDEKCIKIFVRKRQWKRPLGIARRRWEECDGNRVGRCGLDA